VNVFSRLADTSVEQEQGLTILQNLTNDKVLSEKVRESIAQIWNAPTFNEDKGRNLYNLNNAVTQHMTHDIADERFEYANRVTSSVLKRFDLASRNPQRLKKLWTVRENSQMVVTE
jgi:hypothetical protein